MLPIWDAYAENQAQTLEEYWGEVPEEKERNARIIFIGDSIMAGYGLDNPEEDSVVAKTSKMLKDLEPKYAKSTRIKNYSISGETTSGMVSRLPEILATKPDIAVLAIGGNDALRGVDPDVLYNNLNIILNDLNRAGIYTMFIGMQASPSYGYTYMSKFNSVYAKLADQYSVVFVPFLLEGVAGNRELNQDDGIHPNRFGAAVIAENIAMPLRDMLEGFVRKKELVYDKHKIKEHEREKQKRKAKQEQKAREYELRKQKLRRKYENGKKK